ncbi:MAG: GIY-YIG nuclease family protein [Fidelibacterota bacterium]
MYYVYIIQNPKGRLYIGHAQDVPDRLQRHNSNRSPYTKNGAPTLRDFGRQARVELVAPFLFRPGATSLTGIRIGFIHPDLWG